MMGIFDFLNPQFDTAVFSHQGGRDSNQDAYAYTIKGKRGCWILCDGLGGHKGGEFASHLATQECLKTFIKDFSIQTEAFLKSLSKANSRIYAERQKNPAYSRMSTTAVILGIVNSHALWAHVGDSRLYYFRNNKIFRQTSDHSLTYRLMKAGEITPEQVRSHEDRNRLLRALGNEEVKPEVEKDIYTIEVGDAFLLCSDGFWEYIYENEMETLLSKVNNSTAWLNEMVDTIRSRQPKNADNFTAIAIKVRKC